MGRTAVLHEPKSADARIAEGRRRRELVSRAAQRELKPKERAFDPLDVLLAADKGRLARLLPIKYGRMAVSPFAFFRGAASIMAADFGRLPQTKIEAQLCGDAHVQNLGSFAAPDGSLVFDFNDFDETIRGPWEWDVRRMAASIVLAGRQSGHNAAASDDAAADFVARYVDAIAASTRTSILEAARHQIHRERRARPISAALRQSQRATPTDALERFTEPDAKGRPRFRDGRPVFWGVGRAEVPAVLASLDVYRRTLRPESRHLFNLFRPIDVGFKVVGTGSVGMRDYIVLLEGNGPSDPLFLQVKQETASVYAQYLPGSACPHNGKRVAEGQRAIQPVSDLLLGWTSIGEQHFVVRQLNDHKGSIELENLRGPGLQSLVEVAGELLARGHARSGDACMILGYCGGTTKIVKAVRDFARQYADQTEADYRAFVAAVRKKRIAIADSAG